MDNLGGKGNDFPKAQSRMSSLPRLEVPQSSPPPVPYLPTQADVISSARYFWQHKKHDCNLNSIYWQLVEKFGAAIISQHKDVVKQILTRFAGENNIATCATCNRPELILNLLSQGKTVEEFDPKTGLNALHTSARDGNLRLLQLLVDQGVDVNVTAKTATDDMAWMTAGKTPITLALESKKTNAVYLLIKAGARVSLEDCDLVCSNEEPVLKLRMLVAASRYATTNYDVYWCSAFAELIQAALTEQHLHERLSSIYYIHIIPFCNLEWPIDKEDSNSSSISSSSDTRSSVFTQKEREDLFPGLVEEVTNDANPSSESNPNPSSEKSEPHILRQHARLVKLLWRLCSGSCSSSKTSESKQQKYGVGIDKIVLDKSVRFIFFFR